MLGIKLNYVSKRDSWYIMLLDQFSIRHGVGAAGTKASSPTG